MPSTREEWRPEQLLATPTFLAWRPPYRMGVLTVSSGSLLLLLTACAPYLSGALPLDGHKDLTWALFGKVYAKNLALSWLWYGGLHYLLYVSRQSGADGLERKYVRSWPRPRAHRRCTKKKWQSEYHDVPRNTAAEYSGRSSSESYWRGSRPAAARWSMAAPYALQTATPDTHE